ncbi:MAG: APC family permease [Elusimicrobiota bacterium]
MNLKRDLGFFDILCLGVNAIVGSGIFLFPGLLAAMTGPASILSFVVTGLLLIPVALCFAWLAARYDSTGGPYLYARDAFGPWVGFGVGWTAWITNMLSLAAVACAISAYMAYFNPAFATWAGTKATAVGVLLILTVLNYRGVRLAASVTDFFTVAKLLPLLAFVGVGVMYFKPGNLSPFFIKDLPSFGGSLLLAFFAFQGFEAVPVPSGEARNPKRDVPLATVASLVFSLVLYAVIQAVTVAGYPGLAGSEKPLTDAAASWWPMLGAILAVGAAVSTVGYTTGNALGGPRYLYALGSCGMFPKSVLRVHERFGTPHVAVIAHMVLTMALVFVLDFRALVDLTNVVVCLQYLVTCAAAYRLGACGPRGTLKGVAVPLLGIGAILVLGSQAKAAEVWACALLLAAGYLAALLYCGRD